MSLALYHGSSLAIRPSLTSTNMSSKRKKIYSILFSVVFGLFAIIYGAKELKDSIQLSKRGKTASAQIVDGWERVSGRLRRHSYTLVVTFRPEQGAPVRKQLEVSESVYTQGEGGGTVTVFYLPENPEICAAGDRVEIRYGHLVFGIVLLAGAVYLTLFFRIPADKEEAAERLNKSLKPLMQTRHEYVPADPQQFKHLDLSFYDEGRRVLEQYGYRFIEDTENLTVRKTSGMRVFVRELLSADGTIMASLFHIKPTWWLRLLGVKEAKSFDLETQFSNGRFLCTTRGETAGALDSPPELDALFLPQAATLEMAMQAHRQRLTGFSGKYPGASAVVLHGAEDIRRAQDEQQRIKAEFRRKRGLSQGELARLGGATEAEVAELHAAVSESFARTKKS